MVDVTNMSPDELARARADAADRVERAQAAIRAYEATYEQPAKARPTSGHVSELTPLYDELDAAQSEQEALEQAAQTRR